MIGLIVIVVIIVACILINHFITYLEAKEENHKEEIEHKAYQKYMLMLEENNLSSINIVTKKGNEETSNIAIKKNKQRLRGVQEEADGRTIKHAEKLRFRGVRLSAFCYKVVNVE